MRTIHISRKKVSQDKKFWIQYKQYGVLYVKKFYSLRTDNSRIYTYYTIVHTMIYFFLLLHRLAHEGSDRDCPHGQTHTDRPTRI